MTRFLTIFIIVFLGACSVSGATFPTSISHIGVEDGLSNGFVLDMAIDNQGFIWASTESGLNRIAGENLTVFRKSSGLLSDTNVSLYFDNKSNKLWIAAQTGGISVFDCSSQDFSNITVTEGLATDRVSDIIPAADGGLYFLHFTGCIQHYDILSKKLTTIIDNIGYSIRAGLDDGNNHLYIGHNTDGMSILDLMTKKISHFSHSFDNPLSLPGNNVRAIHIDSKKNIWIGTNNGLALYNPITRDFKKIDKGTAGNNIFSIAESKDGYLWFSSDLGGISRINPVSFTSNIAEMPETLTMGNSLVSSPNTRKLLFDGSDNMWVANYSTGIDFVNLKNQWFSILDKSQSNVRTLGTRPLYDVISDSSGKIWLSGENELIELNGNISKRYNIDIFHPVHNQSIIYTIYADSKGYIWLGINDAGVARFNTATHTTEQIDLGEKYLDIHAFFEDSDGKIYIGSENGVFSYMDGIVRKESAINDKLESKVIYSIIKTSDGNLWIGTLGGGCTVFDKDDRFIHHLTGIPGNNVNQIYEASDRTVWIASYEGLLKVNGNTFNILDSKAGFTDSHIRAISEDAFGNIWVSTYSGISCLRRKNGKILNYDYHDGVPMGGFVENSVASFSDGTLIFGSPNGICMFNPNLLADDFVISPIEIIETTKLDDNSYKISFAPRDYSQLGQIEYSYMLEGLDKEWHSTDGEAYVVMRGLHPGNYTFKVRAKWKNGDWTDGNIASLPISIEPPLWATWWAKTLYFVMVIGIIALIIYFYNRHVFLKKTLQLRRDSLEMEKKMRHDEQDLNNERLRFYTNVAHELRTPLTLIIGPLEDLSTDSKLPVGYNKKIKVIHESALRLLGLINQIMEFRKTETQNRSLTVSKGKITNTVREIGLRYKELNCNPAVQISINTEEIPEIYYDSEVITTVLNNLLSNAIKYTPEGEISVNVKLIENNEKVEISVSDTGYGISQEALPHIFDRYYQAKGNHQASGTGIGLALVKSLIELHKGTLSVDSKQNVGTTFSFTLSTTETYAESLHIESNPIPADSEDVSTNESENSKPVILVVEDSDEIRNYIHDSLCDDYTVLQARNGKEGVDVALQKIPDLIISDIMMPVMDGLELCRTMKKDIRTSHIPIVLLTAKDSLNDKEIGYESGADSYLTKPFSAKLLRTRIQNLFNNRTALATRIEQSLVETSKVSNGSNIQQELPKLNKLDEAFLNKLNALIEDNISEENLEMEFFTNRMNMSYSTFYRKVKGLTCMTPNEYFRKFKLKYSIKLLVSGEYNISEVALMTGFNSLGYYRRVFKEEYKVTPSQYIKDLKTKCSENITEQ